MTFSLYDATVPSWLQILGSVRGLIAKADAFCAEKGIAEADLLQTRLAEDMRPLAMQLKWVSTHSIGAIEGVRKGVFSPDRSAPEENFAAALARIDATIAALGALTPAEVNGFMGRDMQFSVPEVGLVVDFTAENFLLSFSLPNFYFHAATAYDILRHKGLQIGKRDFLGKMRIKTPA